MMDSTDNGALPTDRATTPDGAEPVVSGKAGIPSAVRSRSLDANRLGLLPEPLRSGVIQQCEESCRIHRRGDPKWLCVRMNHACFYCQDAAAQAIEARRAATLGAVHESAVRKDAPISTPKDQTNEPG